MKRIIIGAAVAAGTLGGVLLSRRGKRQREVLNVVLHALENDQVHHLSMFAKAYDDTRQALRFTGKAGTANFAISTTLIGSYPRSLSVQLGDRQTVVNLTSPFDARYEAITILKLLQDYVREHNVRLQRE